MDKKGQVSIVGVLLVVLALVLTVVALIFILIKPEVLYGAPLQKETGNVIQKQNIDYKEEQVCPTPYMKFGDTCCLDQNYNKICDNDEQKISTENNYQNELDSCEAPYIKKGNSCCIDRDRNRYCDIDEDYYNDDRYTGLSFDIEAPFDLDNVRINRNEISFILNNDASYDVSLKKVRIDDCDSESYDNLIKSDGNKRITLDCDFSSRVDSDIEVDYIKSGTNESFTAEGNIESERRRTTIYSDNYYD